MIVVVLFTAIGLTLKDVLKDVNLGLDLQGGFEVLYQVEPLEEGDTIDDSAVQYGIYTEFTSERARYRSRIFKLKIITGSESACRHR